LSTTQKSLVVEKKVEFANQLNKLLYRFEKGNVLKQSLSIYY